jgi:diguanylate cyclase (GGDEF)-like protein
MKVGSRSSPEDLPTETSSALSHPCELKRVDKNNPLRSVVRSIANYAFPFFLFAAAATVLLIAPFGGRLEVFQKPTLNITAILMAELAVWGFSAVCGILLWRTTGARVESDKTSIRYLSIAFLLFFALERVAGHKVLWPQPNWLQHGMVHLFASFTSIVALSFFFESRARLNRKSIQQAQDRFLAAAECSLDDFYIFDGVYDRSGDIVDFRFSYINPNAERRLHINRESLIGRVLTEVRPFMITSGLILKYREVVRTGEAFTCEIFLDDEQIKATWLNIQVVKLGNGIAVTSRDVTEHKLMSDHVYHLAHYDQLTGLANRTLLDDRLKRAILRARRHKHKVAVFVLDVDNFKRINDSLGHAEGDLLLATVAKRLLSSVRELDTVARLGGDEFVIVMPDFKNIEDVERCGQKIIHNTAQPVELAGRVINVTVSAGVCIYPDSGLDDGELLRNADTAMYAVKTAGRNGLRIFEKTMIQEQTKA